MNRRTFIKLAGAGIGLLGAIRVGAGVQQPILRKPVPSTGEQIPAIGMGTSITFNVGDDTAALDLRAEILREFFDMGGGMVDSSPMYGSSEAVIGRSLRELGARPGLFSATKVWTSSGEDGPDEIEASRKLWGVDRFDLLQVHNLLAWEDHLETLFEMKAQGRLRYVGITTSHGRRHRDIEHVMRRFPIDFVQASYNIVDRDVEQRILPLAAERGIAFIANRPYRRGSLIDKVKRHPLPHWAAELDCETWAAYLLKFIVSHPAVTCAIPATSRVDHMRENMRAMSGVVPDAKARQRMSDHVAAL